MRHTRTNNGAATTIAPIGTGLDTSILQHSTVRNLHCFHHSHQDRFDEHPPADTSRSVSAPAPPLQALPNQLALLIVPEEFLGNEGMTFIHSIVRTSYSFLAI